MDEEKLRHLIEAHINKDKWWDTLSRFIDVLRVNMFMINAKGYVILPPDEKKYGGQLLTDRTLKFDLFRSGQDFLEQFDRQGHYLEAINHYELHSFALPVKLEDGEVIAYIVIGPVILNSRLDSSHYRTLAEKYHAPVEGIIDEIYQVRVVSNIMMKSILDLMVEIIRDGMDLNAKEKVLNALQSQDEPDEKHAAIKNLAQEIYSTVRVDELLATFLDVAIKMTKAECGSIMVCDEETGDLVMKASRGLDEHQSSLRQRAGDGIASIVVAAKEPRIINDEFISGQSNRVRHLLRRPEIKEAVVIPLVVNDKVYGVLNLHSKSGAEKMESSLESIQHLSGLLSSVI